MNRLWNDGLDRLENKKFWFAHEAFEDIWRALPEETGERQAMQALIQFCAACYKVQQIRTDNRTAAGMQRGMRALIDSGLGHLEAAEKSDGTGPDWDDQQLSSAFERLAEIHQKWVDGEQLEVIRQEVVSTARALVSQLRGHDGS